MTDLKTCKSCKLEKTIDFFSINRTTKKHYSRCNDCIEKLREKYFTRRMNNPVYLSIDEYPCTIDPEFFEELKYWAVNKDTYGYYRFFRYGTTIPIHHVVMGMKDINGNILKNIKKGYSIDHINRDKTDNRKANLRIVTNQVNNMNKSFSHYTSTTGFRGISVTPSNTFRVEVYYRDNDNDEKKRSVKYFKNINDAKQWRTIMIKEKHGVDALWE